jgi:hypothetical protein
MSAFLRRLWVRTDGSAAIEAGIVFPALLALTFGTVDLGSRMFAMIEVNNAAQAGAAYAVIYKSGSGAPAVMTAAAPDVTLNDPQVVVGPDAGDPTILIATATAECVCAPFAPWTGMIFQPLTAVVTVRIQ